MSAKPEAGAFPSFGNVFTTRSQEGDSSSPGHSAGGISLSFSSSDDGRNNGKPDAIRRTPSQATATTATTGQVESPTPTRGSYKDNLYPAESKLEKTLAKANEKRQKDKANPVDQDQMSVQSSQRSTATDTQISFRRPTARRSPRSQRRFTVLTVPAMQQDPTSVLENLFISIEQEKLMHKLSGQHYRAINNWLLFLPAITLTLASGVLALISESGLNISDDTRIYYSIAVGVVALIAVFWQALTKQLDLGSRSALHESTSAALKRLSEDILLTMSSTEDVPTEYVTMISEKFGQALDGCYSLVPLRIEYAFTAVQDRMVLILRPPTGQPKRQFCKKDYMRFHATAYDELVSEIIHYWLWPFHLPPPRWVADNALRNFKGIITEGKEAPSRSNTWCPCLGSRDTERSLFDVLPAAAAASQSSEEQEFVRNNG